MTLKQKLSAAILPFVIIALIVTGGHIKNDLATSKIVDLNLRWKIIAGHSKEYSNAIAVGVFPFPYTNITPLIVYFNPKDVMIAEITDHGSKFDFKYIIQTNQVTLTNEFGMPLNYP